MPVFSGLGKNIAVNFYALGSDQFFEILRFHCWIYRNQFFNKIDSIER